ncbi:MFS transporter [Puniceicoccaceae bacterium K14]|nr:MFS transporter [Puniceicoccaceae bacterium K14]
MRITTQQSRIPWSWAVIALMPWFAISVRDAITNTGMAFTLRKFFDDPALIGLVLSTNYAFSLTVGSLVAFISDYIWTPLGRRRPFLIVSFLGAAILSIFLPLSTVGWLTIVLIVLYQFVSDFAGSYEPFTMDIIPPDQRGRSGSITHWYKSGAGALAMAFLIGHFDAEYSLFGMSFSGEHAMYWINACILGAAGFIILFLIREEKPENIDRPPLGKLLTQRFIVEITKPTILRLMGLALSIQTLWQGMYQFEPFLITEQWGYEKTEYGYLLTASMIFTVLLVPIAGYISDRFDRMKLLRIGLYGVVITKIFFYTYFEFFVSGRPPITAVLGIGLLKSTVGSFMAVACVPLIFDYVPRKRLGTLGCAMGLAFATSSFINTNVMGLWIKFSSQKLFNLPEGEYNYFAAYHWIILTGILGIFYIHYFAWSERKGKITRLSDEG